MTPPGLHRALLRGALTGAAVGIVTLLAWPGSARADAPTSVGISGAVSRAATLQDSSRNSTAASFGSPTTDDRRAFSLRWRLPFLVVNSTEPTSSAYLRNFSSSAIGIPGVGLAVEPMQDMSALIPQFRLFEHKKPFHMQAGVISSDVGHGSVVSSFTNAPEGAIRRAGLLLEGNLAGLGGQVLVGDLLAPQSFFAGRVYGRPIMWFTAPEASLEPNELDIDPRTELMGIWVTGLSWALDASAPLDADDALNTGVIFAGGWDNEAALLDNQAVKLIGYLDLNVLAGQRTGLGFGGGAHPGLTAMFDVLGVRFDLSGEYDIGTDAYVPRYFDRTYFLERSRLFGSEYAKAAADVPASHGYNLQLKAGVMEAITLFAEAQDQLPFDTTRGSNSARITVGASGFLLFFGGHVALTQAGIHDYLNPHLFGTGFMATAEGRVALLANVFHLVGRAWRVHDELPRANGPLKFVEQGAMIGLEVNLDVL